MVDDEWMECFDLAVRFYNKQIDPSRKAMNPYEQIICDKYATIFSYDPYTGIYTIPPNVSGQRDTPIPPKIRDCDYEKLEDFRNSMGTVKIGVAKITLYTCIAPGFFIFFNNSQPKREPFNKGKIENPPNLKAASVNDASTGAELLVLHKGHAYRVLVLGQREERYKIIFLDFCQFSCVRLKSLYMPIPSLSTNVIPSSVFIGRLHGIKTLRKKYLPEVQEAAEKMGNGRISINAMIYGQDKDNNVIIDFEGFDNKDTSQATSVRVTHGYEALAVDDPEEVPLEDIVNHKFQAAVERNGNGGEGSLNTTARVTPMDLNATNGQTVIMEIKNETNPFPRQGHPIHYDPGEEIRFIPPQPPSKYKPRFVEEEMRGLQNTFGKPTTSIAPAPQPLVPTRSKVIIPPPMADNRSRSVQNTSRASSTSSSKDFGKPSTNGVLNTSTGSVAKKSPFGRMPGYVEKQEKQQISSNSPNPNTVVERKPMSASSSSAFSFERTGTEFGARPAGHQIELPAESFGAQFGSRETFPTKPIEKPPQVIHKPPQASFGRQVEVEKKEPIIKPPPPQAVVVEQSRQEPVSFGMHLGAGKVQSKPIIQDNEETKAQMSSMVKSLFENGKAETSTKQPVAKLESTFGRNEYLGSPSEMEDNSRTSSSASNDLPASNIADLMNGCSLGEDKISAFLDQVRRSELQLQDDRVVSSASIDSSVVTVVEKKKVVENLPTRQEEAKTSTPKPRALADTFGMENEVIRSFGAAADEQKKKPNPQDMGPPLDFTDEDDDDYSTISDNIGDIPLHDEDLEMQVRESEKTLVEKTMENKSPSVSPNFDEYREAEQDFGNIARVSLSNLESGSGFEEKSVVPSMVTNLRNVIDKALSEGNLKVFYQKMTFLYQLEEEDGANSEEWKKCIDFYNSKVKN